MKGKKDFCGVGFGSPFIFNDFRHAIITNMNNDEIRFHLRDRWKDVEEFERQELRAMSLDEHWQKLNAIVRFAIETGMKRDNDDGEMEVYLRWAKLKGVV